MMMQYGFQCLVLLGSAGYSRAELPLDDSVSLIAPNNTGKTSLINALQFLLIIDKRRMDFGAHDVDKSRRFYFPNNSAYILLEVTLPESGTVVLGCVGKGVSHDYEYFAYRGQLDVDDFRKGDGSLVDQPRLKSHMAERGKLVFSYSSSEFADQLYGRGRRRSAQELAFNVFRLEHASDAEVFQRVLTRTLRLDKLKSAEVKDYLLRIFHRDMPNAAIDFKQEWDKAFNEVNSERAQYQAALNLKGLLDQLERDFDERLTLRGKLCVKKPLIEEGLRQWQAYYEQTHREYQDRQSQIQDLIDRQFERVGALSRRGQELKGELAALTQETAQLAELEQYFALIESRSQLEDRHREAVRALEAQITLVGQAGSRSLDAIQRELGRVLGDLERATRELNNLSDNLYRKLAAQLLPEQLDQLNRVLSSEVMTLAPSSFDLDATRLRGYLESVPGGSVLAGLSLALDALTPQHVQRSEAELRERLGELEEQRISLESQAEVAQEMEAAKQLKRRLDQDVRAIEAELGKFDQLLTLRATAVQRETRHQELEQEQLAVEEELAQSGKRSSQLNQQLNDNAEKLRNLGAQHEEIGRRRNQRVDVGQQFNYLGELRHHPWLGPTEIPLESLAAELVDYQGDCNQLLQLDRRIQSMLLESQTRGLTKYLDSELEDDRISRLVDFAHHLPQEAEALEKKARSAVVNVTLCLRELRDGLHAFKSRMREFNRLINHRQLSNLKTFKIEPEDEGRLVEAIDLMISTAEQVESGDSFELFNQGSVLDDAKVEQAKKILVDEGTARNGLKVADLFRLSFVVGQADASPESFDDLDSAASNGTVLMAKLVTGLAMLHLMQDKRHRIQAICYLDEALALDPRNQKNLIDTASEFGFALIFASPAPLTTARYCVPIVNQDGRNHISRKAWQILEPIDGESV